MTVEQWIGVWLVAVAFLIAGLTVGVVTIGLYLVVLKQEERRYGLRRGWSRSEAGVGLEGQAVDGSTDLGTLARVGWVETNESRRV